MQTTTNQLPDTSVSSLASPTSPTVKADKTATYPPLDQETRSAINTASAAFHLNRKPQTLRIWACLENGPIRPIRVNGRLAWKVCEIRALLQIGSQTAQR